MKYILTETQLKLLVEQSGESSLSCDKNVSKGAGYLNNWKSMDENKRKELVTSIRSTLEQGLNRSKEEYIKWFQHPATIQKFRTPEEKEQDAVAIEKALTNEYTLEEALKFGFYNKRNSWFDSSGDYVGKLWNIDGKQLIIK